jgi:hypothetical protein
MIDLEGNLCWQENQAGFDGESLVGRQAFAKATEDYCIRIH